MFAVILALLSSLSWGTGDFIGGTVTRRLPVVKVLGISQLVGLVGMCLVATATGSWGADSGYLPWALVGSLVGAASLGMFYLALALGTMGVVAPITTLGAVIPLAWGYANGERPSGVALAGIVVALIGVVAASGPEVSGAAGLRPVLLAVAAAVGFGIVLVCFAEGSRYSAVMTVTAARLGTGVLIASVLVACLVVPRVRVKVLGGPQPGSGDVVPLIAIGVFDTAANVLFGAASARGLVSITAILGSLYPVVTVILAAVIHGERLKRIQIGGVALAFVGAAAMSLS